mmetsp:Transcript_37542/g.69865  ORF Transcript_37542/g.69865 Transcript_37542/m.69865 type:complete len:576 (+) Transcript_37542:80-1807(+)
MTGHVVILVGLVFGVLSALDTGSCDDAQSFLQLKGKAVEHCVIPATKHILYSDNCGSLQKQASTAISWAGMRGEYENAQLLLRVPHSANASLVFHDLVQQNCWGSTCPRIGSDHLSWKQVGFVHCEHTTRYSDSGGGWRPDPLLPPDSRREVLLQQDVAETLWLTVHIPKEALPTKSGSSYSGTVTVKLFGSASDKTWDVPISLEVWDIDLPSPSEANFKTDMRFSMKPLMRVYGRAQAEEVKWDFYNMLFEHRLPPVPRGSVDEQILYNTTWMVTRSQVNEFRLPSQGISCPNKWTKDAVEGNLARADETLRMMAANQLQRIYAYGFDEVDASCEGTMRALFGALKSRFPQVRTMAALNWGSHMPPDLPLSTWVLPYHVYKEDRASKWLAGGPDKELFLYHCVEPSGPEYLNLFIERPLIHARLLFWLGAMKNVQGWLHWVVNEWADCPAVAAPHKPLERIGGTSKTNFDPRSYIWCQTDPSLFVNGDGYYVYPGASGPLASSRLAAIRDALEDVELFRMLPREELAELLKGIVRGPKSWTDDPMLLETIRRRVARRVLAKREKAVQKHNNGVY